MCRQIRCNQVWKVGCFRIVSWAHLVGHFPPINTKHLKIQLQEAHRTCKGKSCKTMEDVHRCIHTEEENHCNFEGWIQLWLLTEQCTYPLAYQSALGLQDLIWQNPPPITKAPVPVVGPRVGGMGSPIFLRGWPKSSNCSFNVKI